MKSKIQQFVEGLIDPNLPEAQQSVILSTDSDLIGSGTNVFICSNRAAEACSGPNEKCKNYGEACQKTYNRDCENLPGGTTPPAPANPLCSITIEL